LFRFKIEFEYDSRPKAKHDLFTFERSDKTNQY